MTACLIVGASGDKYENLVPNSGKPFFCWRFFQTTAPIDWLNHIGKQRTENLPLLPTTVQKSVGRYHEDRAGALWFATRRRLWRVSARTAFSPERQPSRRAESTTVNREDRERYGSELGDLAKYENGRFTVFYRSQGFSLASASLTKTRR